MKRRGAEGQRNLPPMGVESVASSPTVSKTAQVAQARSNDPAAPPRSVPVDPLLLLRQSVSELGYTLESLSAAMHNIDTAYLHRLLNGEKPFQLTRLPEFPDDVEALFVAKYAEAFGQVVVAPVTRDEAVRQLVSGLVGVLAPAGTRRSA